MIYKDKLKIIIGDALNYPIWNLGAAPRQVITNLPYNVGTKMLITWLKYIQNFDLLTLMFQKRLLKEQLQSLVQNYGRLSILINWLTESSILFDVPSEAFIPNLKLNRQ